MSRRHSRVVPPLVEHDAFIKMTDYEIRTAIDIMFGAQIVCTRQRLMWLGAVSQEELNAMSDRQVRKYDLKPWANRIIRVALSALVEKQNRKPSPDATA